MKKIAILLAAFNGTKWIEEQIKSICEQKSVILTLYISVDLSVDRTFELCETYSNKNQSIFLLPYGKKFGCAAKNFFFLIREVNFDKYDFVALSDQDDIWDSNKLIRAINSIIDNDCDAYSSDVIAFWKNGKSKKIKKSWKQKKFDYIFESAGPGCTYVFKSKALIDFKNFLILNWVSINQIAFHDWIIYAYLRHRKYRWLIDDLPLLKYRQHDYNEFGSNLGYKAFFKRILLVKKKWYSKEVFKIASLLKVESCTHLWFRIKNFWQLRRRSLDAIFLLISSIFFIY
jgi:rhamnosyltransferase